MKLPDVDHILDRLHTEIDIATSNNPINEGFTFGNKQIYQIVKPEQNSILVGIEYEYNVDDDKTEELADKHDIEISNSDEDDSNFDEDAWMNAIDEYVSDIMERHKKDWITEYANSVVDELDPSDLQTDLETIHIALTKIDYLKSNNLYSLVESKDKITAIKKTADDLYGILSNAESNGNKSLSVLSKDQQIDLEDFLKLPYKIQELKFFIFNSKILKTFNNIDMENYDRIQSYIGRQHNLPNPSELESMFGVISDAEDIDLDEYPMLAGADKALTGEQTIIVFEEYFDDILHLLNTMRDSKNKDFETINSAFVSMHQFIDEEMGEFHSNNSMESDLVDTLTEDGEANYEDVVGNRDIEHMEEAARDEAYNNINREEYRTNNAKNSKESKVEIIMAELKSENEWGINYQEEIQAVTTDDSVPDGVETITEALPLPKAIALMEKMFKHINDVGSTANNTGMHVNMSIKGLNFTKDGFDPVKMVMLLDNYYLIGKSIDKAGEPIVKYPVRTNVNNMLNNLNIDIAFDLAEQFVKGGVVKLIQEFEKIVNTDYKFQGINFKSTFTHNVGYYEESTRRVEFRYMGNKNYEKRMPEMVFDIYRFAYAMMAAFSPTFGQEDYYKMIVRNLDRVIKEKYPDMTFISFVSAVKRGATNINDISVQDEYTKNKKLYDSIVVEISKLIKEKKLKYEDLSYTFAVREEMEKDLFSLARSSDEVIETAVTIYKTRYAK